MFDAKKFASTLSLVAILGGAVNALPAGATGENPSGGKLAVEKTVTIQDLLKQIQSGQGLDSCASTGNVLGASLTDVQVASLKQAGYNVVQKGDVYDVLSPKSAAAVCDVKSSSSSTASSDATGGQSWNDLSVANQQKLATNGYNSVKFDGLSPNQKNKVMTDIGIGNDNKSSADAKTGAVTIKGNDIESTSLTRVNDPGLRINGNLGLDIQVFGVVNACQVRGVLPQGPLAQLIGNLSQDLRYETNYATQLYLDGKEEQATKFIAFRTILRNGTYGQSVVTQIASLCGVPVTPPGREVPPVPPTVPPIPPTVPPVPPTVEVPN